MFDVLLTHRTTNITFSLCENRPEFVHLKAFCNECVAVSHDLFTISRGVSGAGLMMNSYYGVLIRWVFLLLFVPVCVNELYKTKWSLKQKV